MSVEFSVPLSQIAEALNLTEVYVAENYKETNISTVEINRPGLELTGYLEFFDNKRIQVLGNTEFSYLGRYGPEAQKMVIDSIFSFGPPAVIICVILNRQTQFSKVQSCTRCLFSAPRRVHRILLRHLYNILTKSLLRESPVTAFLLKCTAKAVCLRATAVSVRVKPQLSLLSVVTALLPMMP